jgi:hypothetical protein
LLLAVDGLPSYVKAFRRAFRTAMPRQGKRGQPSLIAWPNIAVVQVVKRRLPNRILDTGLEIERRLVQGCQQQVERYCQVNQH